MGAFDVPDLGAIRDEQQAEAKEQQVAADLSAEAIAARFKLARFEEAAAWARSMQRAFKGIRGAPNRRQRVQLAIEKYGLEEL